MADPFIGEIRMFGLSFAPRGWAKCDGQLLAIAQNQSLFSILGTTYGGDGESTLGLPDLRGRIPIHAGSGPGRTPRSLGASGGAETVVLAAGEMANHTHAHHRTISGATASQRAPDGNFPAILTDDPPYAASGTSAAQPTGDTGGGQSHNNMSPFQVVNYCIAITGTFPSRN
jgi:microcystin-dependent protein